MSILKLVEADSKFKYELKKVPGAERLTLCLQCGTCSADCPVAKRTEKFRPRLIAKLAILGFKDKLFSSGVLWLCAGCYTCSERCPQKVKPTEVIAALRRICIREGNIPQHYKKMIELIADMGRLHEVSEFENEIRADMGLPPVPEANAEAVKHIISKTGLDKIMGITFTGGEE